MFLLMVFDEWSNKNKHLGWGDINVSFFFSICIVAIKCKKGWKTLYCSTGHSFDRKILDLAL